MRSSTRTLLLCGILALSQSACAFVNTPVGIGLIYTGVQGPVDTGTQESQSKQGRACMLNILGLVAVGDASLDAAKKNGRIRQVASVDFDATAVLGIFSQWCTTVRGD